MSEHQSFFLEEIDVTTFNDTAQAELRGLLSRLVKFERYKAIDWDLSKRGARYQAKIRSENQALLQRFMTELHQAPLGLKRTDENGSDDSIIKRDEATFNADPEMEEELFHPIDADDWERDVDFPEDHGLTMDTPHGYDDNETMDDDWETTSEHRQPPTPPNPGDEPTSADV